MLLAARVASNQQYNEGVLPRGLEEVNEEEGKRKGLQWPMKHIEVLSNLHHDL